MITLKPTIIELIQGNGKLRLKIQVAADISDTTLSKYLKDNDHKLANVNVLDALIANTDYKNYDQLLLR